LISWVEALANALFMAIVVGAVFGFGAYAILTIVDLFV